MSKRPGGRLLSIVETVVLTAVIFLGIQTFVAQPYRVEQGSMENTLLPNQYVLVDKLTPRFNAYGRGDIVVFVPPGDLGSTPFIKRVIGLPGDVVDLRRGQVLINGQAISEPYVYPGQTTGPVGGQQAHWVVPPQTVFVMGDHREVSTDSRVFGSVPLGNVVGRAWLRYWPFDTFGVLAGATYSN